MIIRLLFLDNLAEYASGIHIAEDMPPPVIAVDPASTQTPIRPRALPSSLR